MGKQIDNIQKIQRILHNIKAIIRAGVVTVIDSTLIMWSSAMTHVIISAVLSISKMLMQHKDNLKKYLCSLRCRNKSSRMLVSTFKHSMSLHILLFKIFARTYYIFLLKNIAQHMHQFWLFSHRQPNVTVIWSPIIFIILCKWSVLI